VLFDPAYLLTVLLAFVRVGGVLVAAPPFRQPAVPVLLKVFVAVLVAYSLAGFVSGPLPPGITEPLGFVVAFSVEALTGVLLGFAARFAFFAVEFAAEAIGFQMSLSLAQAFNPMDGSNSNPLGHLLSMGFLVLFLVLDGPQQVFSALALSFELVPLGGAALPAAGPLLLDWAGLMFRTALRMAAPFMVAMLLVDVTLAVFARVVPQADFFSIGLPMKLLAGLMLAGLFIEVFGPMAVSLIGALGDDLARLVYVLASG
jgi:flagellar biosynthesis protein FliR